MIGNEATRADDDPRAVERTEAELGTVVPFRRVAAPIIDSPPTGRPISFLAWGVAGGTGILIWVLIFKLLF